MPYLRGDDDPMMQVFRYRYSCCCLIYHVFLISFKTEYNGYYIQFLPLFYYYYPYFFYTIYIYLLFCGSIDRKLYKPSMHIDNWRHVAYLDASLLPSRSKGLRRIRKRRINMANKINIPVNDKEDAHQGWAVVSTADVCPQCRKIECDCEDGQP